MRYKSDTSDMRKRDVERYEDALRHRMPRSKPQLFDESEELGFVAELSRASLADLHLHYIISRLSQR